jgi:hypothetical protein
MDMKVKTTMPSPRNGLDLSLITIDMASGYVCTSRESASLEELHEGNA